MCELLAEEVFSKVPFPCIIAGKSPSERLRSKALKYKNITIIPDPEEEQMLELIREAHINLLPARSSNGFKLKLLYALFAGRHCLVNSIMVRGTMLDSSCHIADDSPSLIEKINTLMRQPFTDEMISDRSSILIKNFNNSVNAEKLIRLLF
jgi:glycosyltransferase involved in cell wall biosynthesis